MNTNKQLSELVGIATIKGEGTSTMKKESIKITFGQTVLQRLQDECDRLGIEKSALIAVAVDQYLRNNCPKPCKTTVDATGNASEANTRTE